MNEPIICLSTKDILLIFAVVFVLRYLYQSLEKWYKGCPSPWNPFIKIFDHLPSEEYERGFRSSKLWDKQPPK